MLIKTRQWIMRLVATRGATSLMVGSYITARGDRAVAVRLLDGWQETAARLSPEGARACARQLNEWADWADKGNVVQQWQAIIRTATKIEPSPDATADAPAE